MNAEEKKTEEDLKKKVIKIDMKKELFPAISANGRVKINLNIGGQAFRMN